MVLGQDLNGVAITLGRFREPALQQVHLGHRSGFPVSARDCLGTYDALDTLRELDALRGLAEQQALRRCIDAVVGILAHLEHLQIEVA